jgi:hypothetical protein
MGLRMRKILEGNTAYMGDLPPLMAVLRTDLINNIEPKRVVKAPLISETSRFGIEDFLSIPVNGLSNSGMQNVFYETMESSTPPRIPLPGRFSAVGFQASQGEVNLSGTPLTGAQVTLKPGTRLDYDAMLSQRGLTQIKVRLRATGIGNVDMEFFGPPAGILSLPWAESSEWQEVSSTWNLPVEGFSFSLSSSDSLEIDWIEFLP